MEMRRLFRSRGAAARQDILAAENVGENRKAKEQRTDRRGGRQGPRNARSVRKGEGAGGGTETTGWDAENEQGQG